MLLQDVENKIITLYKILGIMEQKVKKIQNEQKMIRKKIRRITRHRNRILNATEKGKTSE
jgi:hypothetical protein